LLASKPALSSRGDNHNEHWNRQTRDQPLHVKGETEGSKN
jgi:hypothetical protein